MISKKPIDHAINDSMGLVRRLFVPWLLDNLIGSRV